MGASCVWLDCVVRSSPAYKPGGTKGKRKEEKPKKSDTVIVTPDEYFENRGFKLYVDPNSTIYDATLSKTDADNNNNKYYITQAGQSG